MIFHRNQFDLPLANANKEVNQILFNYCREIDKIIQNQGNLLQRIRERFMASSQNPPKITQLADQLGMSERTLRRKLAEEGVSYSQLLHRCRCELAIDYIENSSLATKEISYLLGYDDISSFRRAFKCWTGETVNSFKHKHCAASSALPQALSAT